MTAVDQAWVEEVARALHARYCTCGSPDRIERRNAGIAVSAVEPLIRDAVLADLRAKAEGLRDESIWARRGTVVENGLDTVPSAGHNGRTSLADAVLALIEEADRG